MAVSHGIWNKISNLPTNCQSRKSTSVLVHVLGFKIQINPDININSLCLYANFISNFSGKNGFVPNFDPEGDIFGEGKQFGCVQPNPELQFRFLILVCIIIEFFLSYEYIPTYRIHSHAKNFSI